MRAAKELCNDPAFALHFGEEVDASEMSLVHMMGGATNMVDALAVGNRYARLAIEVEGDGTGDRFQLRRIAGQLWFVDARRNPNEFPELTESTFARMSTSMRKLPGDWQIIRAVRVTHEDPATAPSTSGSSACRSTFGSDMNAIRIDEALLSGFAFPAPSHVRGRRHAGPRGRAPRKSWRARDRRAITSSSLLDSATRRAGKGACIRSPTSCAAVAKRSFAS